MAHHHGNVTEEERREFLKLIGAGTAVAAGGATLEEARDAAAGLSAAASSELAPVGENIRSELTGELDAGLLASGQAGVAEAAGTLAAAGLTADGLAAAESPGTEFATVAEAGWPVYDHLAEVGMFETTTELLPQFTPGYIESSVHRFATSELLAEPLAAAGLTGGERLDLLATIANNRQRLVDHHWVATDQLDRAELEIGEKIPTMTKGAAGGVLLWLDELDQWLWQSAVLLTDELVSKAVWHSRSMAAGFLMMAEGAKIVAEGTAALSDEELGALLSAGFALQTISQHLLPEDALWITESMRAPRGERTVNLNGGMS